MKTKERSMGPFPLLLLSIGLGVTPQIYPQQGSAKSNSRC